MMRLVLLAALVAGCAPHDPRENALPNNIPSTGEFSRESREVLGQDALIDRSVLPQNPVTKPQTLRREVVGIRQEAPVNLPPIKPLKPLMFPVSVQFNGTKLDSVLELFARTAGYSLVLSEDLRTTLSQSEVTFEVKEVPWQQAYDLLMDEGGLVTVYEDVARVLRVMTQEDYRDRVTQIIADREAELATIDNFRRLETIDPLAPKRIERVYLQYIKPVEAKTKLELALATLYGFPPSVVTPLTAQQPLSAADTLSGFSIEIGAQPEVPATEERTEFERYIPAILVDNESGSLLMRGSVRQLDEAAELLAEIDVLPRQVILEAFFVEVTDSFEQELGVRLSGRPTTNRALSFGQQPNLTTAAPPPDAPLFDFTDGTFDGAAFTVLREIGSGALRLELEALEKEGFSRVVSSPKILTTSGRAGTIKQNLNFVYRGPDTTTRVPSPVEGEPDDIETVPGAEQTATATLGIDAIPVAVGDKIHLDLALENTVFTEALDGLDRAPSTSEINVASSLILADNEIVVIGGVALDSASLQRDRVPVANELPVVGPAFRGNDTAEEFTKLLIFIAPRIL